MSDRGGFSEGEKRVQQRENWRQRAARMEAEQDLSDEITYRGAQDGSLSLEKFKQNQRAVRTLAFKDERTGLGNLRDFRYEFDRMRHDGLQIGMIIFDIDNFMRLNDTYGHPVGDEVLEVVGKTGREMPFGGELFRVGGEEFVLLFDTDGPDDLQQMAALAGDTIINGWQRDEKLKNRNLGRITVSMGAAILGENEDLDHFFDRVDQLLYKAKRADPESGAPGRQRAMIDIGPGNIREISFRKG